MKNAFRDAAKAGRGTVRTKKPQRPSEGEVQENPRARPAKLRAFERWASARGAGAGERVEVMRSLPVMAVVLAAVATALVGIRQQGEARRLERMVWEGMRRRDHAHEAADRARDVDRGRPLAASPARGARPEDGGGRPAMRRRRPVTALPRHMPVGQLRRNLEAVQRFRLNVVFGALLILFVGLLGRLGKLQVVDAAAWSAEASQRHDRHHTFRGLKGRIHDRHGRTLVTSRRVLSVVGRSDARRRAPYLRAAPGGAAGRRRLRAAHPPRDRDGPARAVATG